jgi:hypothetical protein
MNPLLQPLSNDMIVFSDLLFPALTICAAAIEAFGHVRFHAGSAGQEKFNATLGRFLEFLRQDCCFSRDDVQSLLQVQLRTLCPNLSSHFSLVAQLEASAGIMTHHHHHQHYHEDSHRYHHQKLNVMPTSDACPWELVRARCMSLNLNF